jgi:hypothetical protein
MKIRCDRATVLFLAPILHALPPGSQEVEHHPALAPAGLEHKTVYRVGEQVSAVNFDPSYDMSQCLGGIYFFPLLRYELLIAYMHTVLGRHLHFAVASTAVQVLVKLARPLITRTTIAT